MNCPKNLFGGDSEYCQLLMGTIIIAVNNKGEDSMEMAPRGAGEDTTNSKATPSNSLVTPVRVVSTTL
jgi:hypothetical protein